MEIVIAVIVIVLIGYWAYTNFNKEKADGSHVLDTFTKPTEVVPPAPVVEPAKVETPAPKLVVDGHGNVHEVAPVPKAKRAPAVKKPRAPAKPRAKKTPAK
jgi:hypothetical protein